MDTLGTPLRDPTWGSRTLPGDHIREIPFGDPRGTILGNPLLNLWGNFPVDPLRVPGETPLGHPH